MNFFNRIDPRVRIGPTCFYMNLSGIYEGNGAPYLSLAFTHADFIYNKQIFTEFINPKPSIEYISKDNELVIAVDTDSKYINCIIKYLEYFSNAIYNPVIECIGLCGQVGLQELKDKYLGKGLPVMYPSDYYYTYEDYIKLTSNILHFHTTSHMAILTNINFENGTAEVVDKFYKFKGNVQLENLRKSIHSEYIDSQGFYIIRMEEFQDVNEIDGFNDTLLKNFRQTLEPEIVMDGTRFDKNIKGLESFVEDFEDIVTALYNQKGKYAPQFLSKLVSQTILQREGFSNLLDYLLCLDDSGKYKELSELTKKSNEFWRYIDMYNDKYYLKGKTILEVIDKYKSLLDELVINDRKLYEVMKGFTS